jgi:hypothetical protein
VQYWILLAQTVQAVVIVVGAFYLNYLVREQRAAKDATLETKNALIEHLKSLSAPALARDLQDLTRYADEMAAKNKDLRSRNDELADNASKVSDLRYRLGFVEGLEEGRAALRLVFGGVLEEIHEQEMRGLSSTPSPRFMEDIQTYIGEMVLLNGRVIEGQKPEPAFGPRADEQEKRLQSIKRRSK